MHTKEVICWQCKAPNQVEDTNAELLEALGKALNERIGMFDDPADDWLCLDLSFAIHKAKEERC